VKSGERGWYGVEVMEWWMDGEGGEAE